MNLHFCLDSNFSRPQLPGKRCWFVLILVMVFSLPAWAQLPTMDEFSSRDAVKGRLKAAQAELAADDTQIGLAYRELLEQLEDALYQHLEAIDDLEKMDRENHGMKNALSDWRGFEQPPPYSVLFVDELRSRRESLERQQRAAQSRHRIISQTIDDDVTRLLADQVAVRQLNEQVELAASGAKRRQLSQTAQGEELASRVLTESIARLKLRKASHELQLETIASALELNTLQIDVGKENVQFTDSELEDILHRIATERSGFLELVKARRAAGGEGPQVTWKIEFLGLEKEFWTQLHKAMNGDAQTGRFGTVDNIHKINAKLDDWVEVIRLLAREAAEESVSATTTQDDLLRVTQLQEQVVFAIEELAHEGIHGKPLLDRFVDGSLALWNFELYVAKETVSVGGNKVTISRQVTLGKLLRLAFILVIGWLLLRFVSRGIRSLVVRWVGTSEETANLVASWTFGFGLIVLLFIGMNEVHIPFTAFAFLGGTLAIGIGFGAQTLLKNFISGVILTLERPFKVGDLVGVGDIIGHIRHIGMRASEIRQFNGIDTLIPNSTMLENQVNNWTLHDNALRGAIDVGVAYGTNTRDVAHILLNIAQEHGRVLKAPKPEVRFEEFGNNSLNFRLLYWFDAAQEQGETLESNLRFMVDRAFENAGIKFPFPQRDVHFDDDKPLRIEVQRTAKPVENKND